MATLENGGVLCSQLWVEGSLYNLSSQLGCELLKRAAISFTPPGSSQPLPCHRISTICYQAILILFLKCVLASFYLECLPVSKDHCLLLKSDLPAIFVLYDSFRGSSWLEKWWTIATNWTNQILSLSLGFWIEIQKQPFSLYMWVELKYMNSEMEGCNILRSGERGRGSQPA